MIFGLVFAFTYRNVFLGLKYHYFVLVCLYRIHSMSIFVSFVYLYPHTNSVLFISASSDLNLKLFSK